MLQAGRGMIRFVLEKEDCGGRSERGLERGARARLVEMETWYPGQGDGALH